MRKSRRLRALAVVALAATSLVTAGGAALADSEESNRVVHLDDRYEGWFSNGMVNDPAACGPFASSEEAVVWHLFLDVPEQVVPEAGSSVLTITSSALSSVTTIVCIRTTSSGS